MDSQHDSGIPRSDKRSSSDATNNTAYATPKHGQAQLPQQDTRLNSHGLTPPHEHQDWYQDPSQASPSHLQHFHDASVPRSTGHNHPPTPPMREAGFDALQRSLTHQSSRLGRDRMGPPQYHTEPARQHQDTHSQGYPSLSPYDPRGLLQPALSYSAGLPRAQQFPPQARSTQSTHYPPHVVQPQFQQQGGEDASTQAAQKYMAHQKMMPPSMPFYGAPSPTHGLPQYPVASPAVQQWPTSTLAPQPYIQRPPGFPGRSLSIATAVGPSPGHDGITPVDDKTKKQMARYTQAAQIRRASLTSQDGVSPGPATPKKGTKRKKPLQKPDQVAATPPPSLRRPSGQETRVLNPGLQSMTDDFLLHHPHFNVRSSQYSYDASNPYSAYPSAHAPSVGPTHDARLLREITGTQMEWFSGRSPTQATAEEMVLNTVVPYAHTAPAFPPPQMAPSPVMGLVDWDDMHLSIARDYSDFKYSVYHYEVNTALGYSYAQSWLEDMLSTNLKPGQHKWHTHTSPGFIVNGSRLSVLVLHNAVNSFSWHDTPDTTTTIGVYGIEHDQIHWKTVTPSLKWIFDYSAQPTVNTLALEHKYTSTEPKPRERRWHKAYYLAASRRSLKGMLNRPEGEVEKEKDPFVIRDFNYSYPYEFTEEDLDSSWGAEGGWECSVDESEAALEKIKQEMEGWEWRERECVVTGCSEWE